MRSACRAGARSDGDRRRWHPAEAVFLADLAVLAIDRAGPSLVVIIGDRRSRH